MYILRRADRRELNVESRNNPVIAAFNKHHARVRIKIEWGIGGLNSRFRIFLETTPNQRTKFALMFKAVAILTNFIHRRRRNFEVHEIELMSVGALEGFAADWEWLFKIKQNR